MPTHYVSDYEAVTGQKIPTDDVEAADPAIETKVVAAPEAVPAVPATVAEVS